MYKLIAALDDADFNAHELYHYVLETIREENFTENFWLNLAHVYILKRYGTVKVNFLLDLAKKNNFEFIPIVAEYEKALDSIDEQFLLTRFVNYFNPDINNVEVYIHEIENTINQKFVTEIFKEMLFERLYLKKHQINSKTFAALVSLLEHFNLEVNEENLDKVLHTYRSLNNL